MLQQIILPKYNSKLEEQLIKLSHASDLPLHFNKTGNKNSQPTQRVGIFLILQLRTTAEAEHRGIKPS